MSFWLCAWFKAVRLIKTSNPLAPSSAASAHVLIALIPRPNHEFRAFFSNPRKWLSVLSHILISLGMDKLFSSYISTCTCTVHKVRFKNG